MEDGGSLPPVFFLRKVPGVPLNLETSTPVQEPFSEGGEYRSVRFQFMEFRYSRILHANQNPGGVGVSD